MANATFDPASLLNTTLSGGDLTATHATSSDGDGARVATRNGLATGKYRFKFTVGHVSGGSSSVGLLLNSGSFDDLYNGVNCAACFAGFGGPIFDSFGFTGKAIGDFVDGDELEIAVWLAFGFWIRRNAGDWNGDPVADPVAGVNGGDLTGFPGLRMTPCVGFGNTGTSNTENFTANFGDTSLGSPLSGYTDGWPAREGGGGGPSLLMGA